MPRLLTSSGFTDAENRVVRAAALMYALCWVVPGSFNYMLVPMLSDLDATAAQTSLLRALPNMAGLLVIFPAGVLGARVGQRRVLFAGGCGYALGGVVIAVGPAVQVVMAGMVLCSLGRYAVLVSAVAALVASTTRTGVRPVAFGILYSLTAMVLLVVPVLAGLLVASSSWRWVAGLWSVSGFAVVLVVRFLLPQDERALHRGELVSPILAGVLLVCVVQVAQTYGRDQTLSTVVVGWAVGVVVASVALVVAVRLSPSPAMSVEPLRRGGLGWLLLVVVLVPFSNLLYYTTVGLQYFYGRSVLAAAVLLVPAQLAASLGSRVSGRLVKVKGATATGTGFLVGVAAVLFLSATLSRTLPIVVPVVVVSLYSGLLSAALVPLQTAVMSRAAPGEEGSVSALRVASTSLGTSLGVISMALLVSAAMLSVYDRAGAGDLDRDEVGEVSRALREGATEAQAAGQYGLPEDEVVALSAAEQDALLAGFRAQGIGGGVVTLAAAGVFWATRRRHPDEPAAAA